MFIIFRLILALLILYAAGFGFVALLARILQTESCLPKKQLLIPLTGSCLLQIIFWWAYAWSENSQIAFGWAVGLPLAMNLAYAYVLKCDGKKMLSLLRSTSFRPDRGQIILWLSLGCLLLYILYPYLLIGEGQYYHSGNGDIFHRLDGALPFLQNKPLHIIFPKAEPAPIQYSSQAFWTRVLMVWNPMDAFMIHSAIHLFLTVLGIYWLLRYVLNFSLLISLGSGLCSIIAHLYFTTYSAGHIGSMMYGAVAPYFIGSCLLWNRHLQQMAPFIPDMSLKQRINSYTRTRLHALLALPCLYYLFVKNTYPGPLTFIFLPFLMLSCHELILAPMKFWQKLTNLYRKPGATSLLSAWHGWRIAGTLLLLSLGALGGMWWLWEQFFIMRLLPVNSWEIAREPEMLMIFWGLFPSELVGSHSSLSFFLSNRGAYTLAFLLALLCSLVALLGIAILCRSRNTRYFGVFAACWGMFYIIIYYFWQSGYYFYKFCYMNLFLVLIAFIVGLATLFNMKLPGKVSAIFILIVFLVPNLFYNWSQQSNLLQRPYHQIEELVELKENLARFQSTALDIPNSIFSRVFDRIFRYEGTQPLMPESTAEYLVRISSLRPDVISLTNTGSHKLWANNIFSIHKKPKRNRLRIFSRYSPDSTPYGPLRWIGGTVVEPNLPRRIERYLPGIQEDWLSETFIDITPRLIRAAIEKILETHNLASQKNPDEAKYFLRLSTKHSDVIQHLLQAKDTPTQGKEIVWRNKLFTLVRVSEKIKQEYMTIAAKIYAYNPFYSSWAHPQFFITMEDVEPSMQFLNLLLASGPSIDMAPFTLSVTDEQNAQIFGSYAIDGVSFVSFPLARAHDLKQPICFSAVGVKEKSLLPFDPRILTMKLLHVELSVKDSISKEAFKILNRGTGDRSDILSPDMQKQGVLLGTGWYELEFSKGEVFRWIGTGATLIVQHPLERNFPLLLDVEPGYSSQGVLSLELINETGVIVQTLGITGGRQELRLTLPQNSERKTQQFRLRLHSQNLAVPGDSRLLNLRVFSIVHDDGMREAGPDETFE